MRPRRWSEFGAVWAGIEQRCRDRKSGRAVPTPSALCERAVSAMAPRMWKPLPAKVMAVASGQRPDQPAGRSLRPTPISLAELESHSRRTGEAAFPGAPGLLPTLASRVIRRAECHHAVARLTDGEPQCGRAKGDRAGIGEQSPEPQGVGNRVSPSPQSGMAAAGVPQGALPSLKPRGIWPCPHRLPRHAVATASPSLSIQRCNPQSASGPGLPRRMATRWLLGLEVIHRLGLPSAPAVN